jgi:membrane protease YdiL (CAAX protease family)
VRVPVTTHAGALRQARLLGVLWWRHLRRSPRRVGESPRLSGTPAPLVFALSAGLYFGLSVWHQAERDVSRLSLGILAWRMLGVLLTAFGWGLSKGAVQLRRRGVRDDAFLDALPLTALARLSLTMIEPLLMLPVPLALPLAAASARGDYTAESWLAIVWSPLAFLVSFVAGHATSSWLRALSPPRVARSGAYAGEFVLFISALGVGAPIAWFWSKRWDERALPLARAWLDPAGAQRVMYLALLACSVVSCAALAAAERFGIDRVNAIVQAPKPAGHARDRAWLERAMLLRQGGRTLLVVFGAFVIGAIGVLASLARAWPQVLHVGAALALFLGATQAIQHALRAAGNDLSARAFLSALPMQPHLVLDGKSNALRLLGMPFLVLLALLTGFAATRLGLSLTYRMLLATAGLWIVMESAPSVAFLSFGVGAPSYGAESSGFALQVLLLPLTAIFAAPSAWSATLAVLCLLAIAWQARRAAHRSVRWLDDPADDVERATHVWRALLALGLFYATQALLFQLLSMLKLPTGYVFAGTVGVSGLLLAALFWRNAARLDRRQLLPERASWWLLALLGGVASGLLALQFLRHLPEPITHANLGSASGEWVAQFISLVLIAPVVEESFFRGWLQKAIAADLAPKHRRWAFVMAALAFALAHVGTYGAPQLVLGLIAGGLFAGGGGLGPSMLAHACHNAVVLLISP